jgi:hypothetical protein
VEAAVQPFVGLLLFLAGIGVGARPLGHATGSTVSVDSTPVAAVRNCGSALLTADYTSGALPPGSNLAQPANGEQSIGGYLEAALRGALESLPFDPRSFGSSSG